MRDMREETKINCIQPYIVILTSIKKTAIMRGESGEVVLTRYPRLLRPDIPRRASRKSRSRFGIP